MKTFDEYQELAQRTSRYKDCAFDRGIPNVEGVARLTSACLGLAGEAGEVCDLLKKHLGHGHPFDRAKVLAELGDVCWYVAEVCSALGTTFSGVVAANVDKLARRYPEGFSAERSMNRQGS